MKEDDIIKSRAITSYRDEPIKRGRGLQAWGANKEGLSLGLGLPLRVFKRCIQVKDILSLILSYY